MTAWWDIAVLAYVGCLGGPIVYVGTENLLRIYGWFRQEHANHAAHMDGLAEGAGLDDRDRREALRRRLRLER